MRIFTAIRHSIDPKLYYGSLWSTNFYPALHELGHEVIESKVDLMPASRFMQVPKNFTQEEKELRTRITAQIVDEVREKHKARSIDLFLSYFYNAHFDPDGFNEIHKLGIPTVNFYCNSIYQFELVSTIAEKVKFSWHTEKEASALYNNIGANPVWVQMAADPKIYYPLPNIKRQQKTCFIGQRYADRDLWIAALIKAAVPLEIYGPGWKNRCDRTQQKTDFQFEKQYLGRKQFKPGNMDSYLHEIYQNIDKNGIAGGVFRTWQQLKHRRQTQRLLPIFSKCSKEAIPFQQISSTVAAYEVILNFSNVWADGRPGSRLIPHVRLRDFEAPMCRTCYITGHTDEISEFFEIGEEIDTYQNQEELVDKVRFYLAHPSRAEGLREAGYRRAIKDHTWKERFKYLFKKIGIKKK